jgi:hypothetical protein
MEHFERKNEEDANAHIYIVPLYPQNFANDKESYTWLGSVAPLEWRGSSFMKEVRVKKRPHRERLHPRVISNLCLGSRGRHHRFHNVSIRAVTAGGSRHRSIKTNCDY